MLTVQNLYASYGAVTALRDINLRVDEGEIVCLLGANGAGKSTLLRSISGILTPYRGKVYFYERDITKPSAPEIVRLGICHVPEGKQLFESLTVLENLKLGAYTRLSKLGATELEDDIKDVLEVFPSLQGKLKQRSGTLSGGEQQMVAIGRGLMGKPRLLLLDEPSLGLAPIVVKSIFTVLGRLRQRGMTILLVEQNVGLAVEISDRGYVLQNGSIVLEGSSEVLASHKELKTAYLSKS